MSEKGAKDGNALPSSRLELGNRLGALLALFPSRGAAAAVAGKSVDQLKLYEKGVTAAPFEVVARLAADRGVSLEWLASGEGDIHLGAGQPGQGGLNKRLLQDVVQAVEELLAERDLELTPEKKGRLVVVLYEYFTESGQIDRPTARAMIEVAA